MNPSFEKLAIPTIKVKSDASPIAALKITTIVEIMRERSKTKENTPKIRSKRETSTTLSIAKKPNDDSSTIGATDEFHLDKLYRHPRLTKEEQKYTARNIKTPILDAGIRDNFKDFETKPNAQKLSVPHPYSFLPLALGEYNDTAPSEISDLNIPVPSLKPIRRKNETPEINIRFPLISTFSKKSPIVNKQGFSALPSFQSTSNPLIQETRNATYINLEDHRTDLKKKSVEGKSVPGYPSDIPLYDPDIIPYVEVPDYSDRREESLDKEDQRIANEKYKEYDDQEFIDPTAPLSGEKFGNIKAYLHFFIKRFFNQFGKSLF